MLGMIWPIEKAPIKITKNTVIAVPPVNCGFGQVAGSFGMMGVVMTEAEHKARSNNTVNENNASIKKRRGDNQPTSAKK